MTVLKSSVLFVCAAVLSSTYAVAQAGPYKIVNTVKVGGEGGFDYVTADSEGRRLYVARSGPGAGLHVYDLDSLAAVGEIANVSSHGATVDPKTQRGFATSKPVTMFDSASLKVLKTLDTQGNPDGYLLDEAKHRVYILSHSAPNVTVLDAKDGAIVGTIDLGGAPEQAALDGKGHMFIDLEDKASIAVVDTATMKMTGTYDLSSKGGGCAGLAIDAKHDVLFAACREKKNMIILSAKDGKILTDLPIGAGCDGVVFNPKTMEAFSSQGDGTLTVIKESSPTSFAVEQTVTTPARAKTLTLDTKTGHILLITAEFGPAPAPVAGAAPGGRPARAPMIPGSFSIVVVGK
jgi:DNA-binding beta-propeller fold protein YncE